MPIKLIVGLGNPGPEYASTRHNAGAWFLENTIEQYNTALKHEKKFKGLLAKTNIGDHEVFLLIPITFMNLSGESVAALARFYKIKPEEILVAHDELDFPPGVVKLKKGGGHGGHNGLRSITQHLGTADFQRLRIGIGHPGDARLVTDYVLHRPSKADEAKIEETINDADRVLESVVQGDIEKAMHQLHS